MVEATADSLLVMMRCRVWQSSQYGMSIAEDARFEVVHNQVHGNAHGGLVVKGRATGLLALNDVHDNMLHGLKIMNEAGADQQRFAFLYP